MVSLNFVVRYLFYCAVLSPVLSLSSVQEQEIQNVIETQFMEPNFIPGVAFSVFYEDDVFATGYGLKDVEQESDADEQTIFGVGSITKSFTATLVVKVLHEAFPGVGVAALDRPIRQLIPDFNFTLSDRYRSEAASFRDLLAHKTCLDSLYLGRTVGSIADAAEFAYRTRFVKEVCPFRTGYTYNNGMYALVGEAIAAVANSTFIDLAENLLRQIGMNDTIIYKPSLDFDQLPQASRGYYRINGQTRRVNSDLFKRMHVALPSGGLMTSPRDMAKYMEFHLNTGKVNGRRIVPAAAMRRLHKASTALDMRGVEGDYAYALGLRLGIHAGWPLESHQGTWPPFTSRISLFPTLNLGIFTAVNARILSVSHKYVHDRVFQIVTGYKTGDTDDLKDDMDRESRKRKTPGTQERPPWKYSNVQMEPKDFEGLYGNPVQGDLTILFNASNPNLPLYLRYGAWGTGFLRKVKDSNSTYYPLWDSDIVGDFLSQYSELPITSIDFGTPNVALLTFDGHVIEFVRNGTLDTFPTPPWSMETCSPQSPNL